MRIASRAVTPGDGARTIFRRFVLSLAFACSFCSTSRPAAEPRPAANVPPEAIAGDWLMETRIGDRAFKAKLHFSITGGILAGSLTDPEGNSRELTKITLKGNQIGWEAGTLRSEGTISGSSMKGTSRRVATRLEGPDGEDRDTPSGPPGATGGRGRGIRRGGRGRAGPPAKITWSAFKSDAPLGGEKTPPALTRTPPGA